MQQMDRGKAPKYASPEDMPWCPYCCVCLFKTILSIVFCPIACCAMLSKQEVRAACCQVIDDPYECLAKLFCVVLCCPFATIWAMCSDAGRLMIKGCVYACAFTSVSDGAVLAAAAATGAALDEEP